MAETIYTPLNVRLQEIRVLEHVPGDYHDDLVTTLYITRFRWKRLRSDALSYVRSKQLCPFKAVFNGRRVTIGRNLTNALLLFAVPRVMAPTDIRTVHQSGRHCRKKTAGSTYGQILLVSQGIHYLAGYRASG
jgi:hypothetical protein